MNEPVALSTWFNDKKNRNYLEDGGKRGVKGVLEEVASETGVGDAREMGRVNVRKQ